MNPRTQTVLAFLVSSMALAFATIFIMIDMLRPFLEAHAASSASWQAELAEIYPFPQVTEVRMLYCAFSLIPLLVPLLFAGRWAAWTTLLSGLLLSLSSLSDGVSHFLLGGRPVLGLSYILAVGLPALIGIGCAWRWARTYPDSTDGVSVLYTVEK